jgi:hypothetical protein
MMTRDELKQATRRVEELDALLELRNRLTTDGAAILEAVVAIRVECGPKAWTETLTLTPEDVMGTIEENLAACRRVLKALNVDPK